MKTILYLVHRMPYPPNKGDKITSFNILKYLAKKHHIVLGCFIDKKEDWQYTKQLKTYCTDLCVVNLSPGLRKILSLSGLIKNEALTLAYYRNKRLQTWVNDIISAKKIEAIFIYSGAMGQYIDFSQLDRRVNTVLDFDDVDSEKWQQYSQHAIWPMSWLYRREADRLRCFESKMANQFDYSVFISKPEAALFKRRVPDCRGQIVNRTQGVDSDYFKPTIPCINPYPEHVNVLVFNGVMDYKPNVEGVVWFCTKIFPQIQKRIKKVRFYIVGMNPSKEVRRLANNKGVVVTGKVLDMRPFLRYAKIAVFPLRIARGIQNKVLEALAMECPVVATKQAATGILEEENELFKIANEEETIIAAIILLLAKKKRNKAGRMFIMEHFAWQKNLQSIEHLLVAKKPYWVVDLKEA